MTHQEISKLRLHNQQLLAGNLQTAAELVYHFGAVQGQEYEQTKWGLGIRLPHLNNADIETEIESGNIYRTHLLRPTWHFVHADDILWMQALTSERVQAINRFMRKQLELTDKTLDRAADIIRQSLDQFESLTRAELSAILSRHRIKAKGLRMIYIMMNAELKGLVANGKRKGKQHTYALLNNPKLTKTDKEEGLSKLAERYFKSRGPATVKDFSTWSGLTIADCQFGINLNGQTFDKISFEEENYYHIPSKISDPSNVPGIQVNSIIPGFKNISETRKNYDKELFLLPVYDELIMGYKDRKSIMQNFKKGQQYKYDCMILYQGQVIGTYKRTIKSKSAFFEFDYFKTANKKQKSLVNVALKEFEKFSNLKVTVLQS
jgi:hypothetical protein